MSFDWDSIKVVNNPELKEIEALFTPISSLGGIESPNEDGSPSGGNDGGNNGGGEDGGGNEQPVIVDCTPPSLPSKCRQRCDAYKDYVSVPGMTMGTQAEMDALYGTGALDINGFRFISKLGYEVSTGDDPTVLPSVDIDGFIPMPAGSADSTPCAPGLVSLNTRTNSDNNRLTALSVSELNEGQYQGSWTDDQFVRPPINRSISYDWRAIINPLTDTGTVMLFELHIPLWTSQSASGFRTWEQWSLSWDKTAGTITVSNGIVSPASQQIAYDGGLIDMDLGFVLGAGGTVAPNPFDGVIDRVDTSAMSGTINGISVNISSTMAITTVVYGFFSGNHANPFSGTVFLTDPVGLYTILGLARVSSALDNVASAIRRSTTGFVATDPDCLAVENWVRPEGCPDCVRPAYPSKCEASCDAYTESLSDGITLGTLEEMDALYSFSEGPAADIGGGVRYIDKNHWSSTDGTQGLPTAGSTYFVPIAMGTVPAEAPCASNLLSPQGVSGLSNDRLTCATAADMEAVEHPGPLSDDYTLRDHLDATASKSVRALVNPIGDQGAFRLFSLSIPSMFGSGTRVTYEPYWTISFDRTAGTIELELTETYIPNTVTQIIPWDGSPIIDINLEFTLAVSFTYQVSPYISRLSTNVVTTGTINGTAITALSPSHDIENRQFQEFMGSHPGSHMYLFETDNNDQFNLLAVSVNPSSLDAIKANLERSFSGWTSTDPDCIAIDNWVAPDGCSENLCPEEGDCPCSCQGQSYDPLGCNASVITGGLYAETDDATRVAGVFPNYNGSFGRVASYEDGVGTNAVWQPHYVEMPNNNTYKIMSGNEVPTLGATDFNWEGLTGFDRTETYEFCALVGKIDSQTAGSRTLLDFTDSPNANSDQQRIELIVNPNYRPTDNATYLSGLDIFCYMARENGNQVSYWTRNEFGGTVKNTVTLPESVMPAAELFTWFSAKVTHTFAEIGPADEGYADGLTNPNYTVYTALATCDYFVNGFPIATGVPISRKSGYNPNDLESVLAAFTPGGVKPAGLRWCSSNTPLLSNGTIPTVRAKNPSGANGNDELAIAFVDIGPGASLIPATEQGRNLKRIDPTYTNYEDCNNCGDTP